METFGQSPKPANGVYIPEPVDPDEKDIAGMRVVKNTEVSLIRQLIHLDSQDKILSVLGSMIRWMRVGKFTGHIHIQMNQGGVKKIETEQEVK